MDNNNKGQFEVEWNKVGVTKVYEKVVTTFVTLDKGRQGIGRRGMFGAPPLVQQKKLADNQKNLLIVDFTNLFPAIVTLVHFNLVLLFVHNSCSCRNNHSSHLLLVTIIILVHLHAVHTDRVAMSFP